MRRLAVVAFVVAIAACGGSRRAKDDGGTDSAVDAAIPTRCAASAECDDDVDCTFDSCSPAGTCRFDPVDENCAFGEVCTTSGCGAPSGCEDDEGCDDGKTCTVDRCTIEGCVNERVDARCATVGFGSACVGEDEDETSGCTPATGCVNDRQCDDDTDCTTDRCDDNRCSNAPTSGACDEDEACVPGAGCQMVRACDATSPTADDDCDDEDFCNGTEVCVEEFGCMNIGNPVVCRDDQACTVDVCDRELNACTYNCDVNNEACGCGGGTCTPALSGRFMLSPAPQLACDSGALPEPEIDYDLQMVELVCTPSMLSVLVGLPTFRDEGTMTQTPVPAGNTFDVKLFNEADCDEEYRLRGTFTDDDHFTGTFTFVHGPGGFEAICELLTGCYGRTNEITGTRVE